MSKPESNINRWSGKSAENVLAESFHELRNPIIRMVGYLNVLKSVDLSEEQSQHFIDEAFNCALATKDVVESVYRYMNEQWKEK
jgi:hypothetical protein